MKSFSKFIEEKSPVIHFKYTDDSSPVINFKHVNEDVSSPALQHKAWMNANENAHLGGDAAEIAERLKDFRNKNTHPDFQADGEKKDVIKKHVRDYTGSSEKINKSLVDTKGKLRNTHDISTMHSLDKVTRRPVGAPLHVFSGIKNSFAETLSVGKKIKLPAYTSTTHDKRVAHSFAPPSNSTGDNHIIHIHIKSGDHGFFTGEHAFGGPSEYETMLPRNTTLKIDGCTKIKNTSGGHLHIWHASIHRQEK